MSLHDDVDAITFGSVPLDEASLGDEIVLYYLPHSDEWCTDIDDEAVADAPTWPVAVQRIRLLVVAADEVYVGPLGPLDPDQPLPDDELLMKRLQKSVELAQSRKNHPSAP